jgi:hypothetical protein
MAADVTRVRCAARHAANAIEQNAPAIELLQWRAALIKIGAASNAALGIYAAPLLERLCFDIGLDLWDSADPTLDEHARLACVCPKRSAASRRCPSAIARCHPGHDPDARRVCERRFSHLRVAVQCAGDDRDRPDHEPDAHARAAAGPG